MSRLRSSILLLAASTVAVGCGGEMSINEDALLAESGQVDTERNSEPEEQQELALRTSSEQDALFSAAGKEFDVPPALLKALSFSQTRYEMVQGETEFELDPEEASTEVDGASPVSSFGMMGLSDAVIARAAELAGVTLDGAKTDPSANVRAAAALLSAHATELSIDRADLNAWAPAVGRFSGLEEKEAQIAFARDEVFETLRLGVGALGEGLALSPGQHELEGEFGTMTQDLSVGPDYSRAVWYPSAHHGTRTRKPSLVIIHTCEGAYTGCRNYLRRNRLSVSSHYVVGANQVAQEVRESRRANHIAAYYSCRRNNGVSCGLQGVQSNNFTIGVEHGGFQRQKSFPASQLENSARLVCDITKSHKIPRDRYHVVGHGKLQPYNRSDPGPNWPWSSYLAKINSFCKTEQTPVPPPTDEKPLVIDSNNQRNDKSRGYIQVSSNWDGSGTTPGYYGTGYFLAKTKPVADGAAFWFHLSKAEKKTIDARWVAGSNRSESATYIAFDAKGNKLGQRATNQRKDGSNWTDVGAYEFTEGWNKVVLSRWSMPGEVVIADAIRVR